MSFIPRALLPVIVVLVGVLGAPVIAFADRWAVGLGAGAWAGTTEGTVFALGGTVDYYPVKVFSLGGLVLLAPGADLTQVAVAAVGRYHYRTRWGAVVPLAGLGVIHANTTSGPGASAASHYVPLGVSLEYQAAKKLAWTATAVLNLHGLTLREVDPQGDGSSLTLLFGVRFGP